MKKHMYRAWIAHLNAMADNVWVYADGSWGYSYEDEDSPMGVNHAQGDEEAGDVLMQYIGIEDTNGEPLFEKDVTNRGVIEWFEKLSWDSGGSEHPGHYIKDALVHGELDWHVTLTHGIEKLGNIFENPELVAE